MYNGQVKIYNLYFHITSSALLAKMIMILMKLSYHTVTGLFCCESIHYHSSLQHFSQSISKWSLLVFTKGRLIVDITAHNAQDRKRFVLIKWIASSLMVYLLDVLWCHSMWRWMESNNRVVQNLQICLLQCDDLLDTGVQRI